MVAVSDDASTDPTLADWEALASKDLRGRPLEELTRTRPEGIDVKPLYTADDVDDLTSESFTKMLQALRRQKGPVDHPIRYLMVTTRTSAISLRQRHRRQDDLRNHAALRADVADQQPVAMDDDLVAAFSRLSPRWRQVLWWNVIEGLSPAEISERMDLGAPAVSALLYRAKQALRAAYAEQVGDDA